ncbi:MAG: signal peptidase I [Planctomycetota bacterium]|nr:MAG: signal peptidase I [Planctomycetota bacterium]
MSVNSTEKISPKKATHKDRVAEIANTFEWLITAFILAFVFRAFVMEAFRIPTGSMADTLKGAHFRLSCPQCAYKYDYGFDSARARLPRDSVPRGRVKPPVSRCPSCGFYNSAEGPIPISYGDRILVLKCIYQFLEPKQWDVVVFKNPLDPTINYIKRLIGRPGETVEIIDGDIYVNGQISRKPPKVQNELWMPVYDNDYQPIRPREGLFYGHNNWQQPFRNISDSEWSIHETRPTLFRLDSPPDKTNSLIYDTSADNEFRATYAYNDIKLYDYRPYCSDLMVRFYSLMAVPEGRIGIALSKYQTEYSAWVDSTGDMVIAKTLRGEGTTELARTVVEPPVVNKATEVKFANVDHELIFQFGDQKLTYDLGRGPNDAGEIREDIQPRVKIFGSGKLTLSHIAVFRDIHYTARKSPGGPRGERAAQGNPFTLGEDEFFVLGDNSPNSEDGRWWDRPGRGNNAVFYREGIVPRDYLVGKALFVYWPSGFRPTANSRFAVIPNVGQMRFIYGGSTADR